VSTRWQVNLDGDIKECSCQPDQESLYDAMCSDIDLSDLSGVASLVVD
jgi:hypothetical protein